MSAKLQFIIPCEGEYCGNCLTRKKFRHGDGLEEYEPYCKLFNHFFLNYRFEDPQPQKRLPECIAAEIKEKTEEL